MFSAFKITEHDLLRFDRNRYVGWFAYYIRNDLGYNLKSLNDKITIIWKPVKWFALQIN